MDLTVRLVVLLHAGLDGLGAGALFLELAALFRRQLLTVGACGTARGVGDKGAKTKGEAG